MLRPCAKNGRGKTAHGNIKVDTKTKESKKKTKEKLDGKNKEGHERNQHKGQWEDRKQWSLGFGQRRKKF